MNSPREQYQLCHWHSEFDLFFISEELRNLDAHCSVRSLAGGRMDIFIFSDRLTSSKYLSYYLTIVSLYLLFRSALATTASTITVASGLLFDARCTMKWFTHLESTTFLFCHFIQIFRASLCNRYEYDRTIIVRYRPPLMTTIQLDKHRKYSPVNYKSLWISFESKIIIKNK